MHPVAGNDIPLRALGFPARNAHGIMGIDNEETMRPQEQCSRRRYKSLTKHHLSHRKVAKHRPAVVKSLVLRPSFLAKKF